MQSLLIISLLPIYSTIMSREVVRSQTVEKGVEMRMSIQKLINQIFFSPETNSNTPNLLNSLKNLIASYDDPEQLKRFKIGINSAISCIEYRDEIQQAISLKVEDINSVPTKLRRRGFSEKAKLREVLKESGYRGELVKILPATVEYEYAKGYWYYLQDQRIAIFHNVKDPEGRSYIINVPAFFSTLDFSDQYKALLGSGDEQSIMRSTDYSACYYFIHLSEEDQRAYS